MLQKCTVIFNTSKSKLAYFSSSKILPNGARYSSSRQALQQDAAWCSSSLDPPRFNPGIQCSPSPKGQARRKIKQKHHLIQLWPPVGCRYFPPSFIKFVRLVIIFITDDQRVIIDRKYHSFQEGFFRSLFEFLSLTVVRYHRSQDDDLRFWIYVCKIRVEISDSGIR